MYENETKPQRALLVSVDTGEYDAESSLNELEELCRTAGAEPALTVVQKRPAPDTATCIGSGMVEQGQSPVGRRTLTCWCLTGSCPPPRSATWKRPVVYG